jgi:hypothetical protein
MLRHNCCRAGIKAYKACSIQPQAELNPAARVAVAIMMDLNAA